MNKTTAADLESLATTMQSGASTIEDFVETLDLDAAVAEQLSVEILEIDSALMTPQDSPLPSIVDGRWL